MPKHTKKEMEKTEKKKVDSTSRQSCAAWFKDCVRKRRLRLSSWLFGFGKAALWTSRLCSI